MSTAAQTFPLGDEPPPPSPPRARQVVLAKTRVVSTTRVLRRLFWTLAAGLTIAVACKSPGQTPESVIGALLIIAAALTPAYLWATGKVRGLPIYPAYALTSVWTFALPLVSEHPIVQLFPGSNQLIGALSIVGFLVIGALCWYPIARRPPRPPAVCWMMNEEQSSPLLLLVLGLCAVWTVIYTAGWVQPPTGVDSLIRAVLMALNALACFILSFRLGSQRLRGPMKLAFFILLGLLVIANLPTLLLIVPMSLLAVSMMAYLVASKRLPWRVGLATLCVFGYLHVGKSDMRGRHWVGDEDFQIRPTQYPSFFGEWIGASWDGIRQSSEDEHEESLLERASLMHWLLYFEAMSPGQVPLLHGETYAVIPHLFIPRILDPEKPRSNEGSFIVAIHYGIQTRDDTYITVFAFGLINEAYANFGFFGIAGLAVLLGVFYGKVAHWARGMPIVSFRALFAVLICSYSFQAEFMSTFYAAALFQSTVVLLVLTGVLMRPRRVDGAAASLLD